MAITIVPVTPDFVAEIGDVDLTKPLNGEDFAAIQQAFWKYAVLIYPQQLSTDQQLAFSERWGPVENERTLDPKATPTRYSGAFSDISNLAIDGKIWVRTAGSACAGRQQTLAYRQFVQAPAQPVFAAVLGDRGADWRPHRNSPTSAQLTMHCRMR